MFTLGGCVIFPLFAGTDRGSRLIGEAGGAQSIPGVAGPAGAGGLAGIAGIAGAQGIAGIPGIPGAPGLLEFADFYALVPPDDAAMIAPNFAVPFPRDGSSTVGAIARTGPSTFLLPAIGTYLVNFQVSADGFPAPPSQLQLRLNGVPIPNSVVGRATANTQIVGLSYVTTITANSILEVINPPSNTGSIIIKPSAGSGAGAPTPVTAHLVIVRVQ